MADMAKYDGIDGQKLKAMVATFDPEEMKGAMDYFQNSKAVLMESFTDFMRDMKYLHDQGWSGEASNAAFMENLSTSKVGGEVAQSSHQIGEAAGVMGQD
ncbi:hypothetical protein, partial [Austwickia sp. TVS 96-490-7B]|uniref:hypothetical protein n=1 Tax=Austwickia sp. TVS 96-490-7B TaxID=2830843 RepID=UPI001C56B054